MIKKIFAYVSGIGCATHRIIQLIVMRRKLSLRTAEFPLKSAEGFIVTKIS